MSDEAIQLSTRVPGELIERIEALVERMPVPAGGTVLTRSTVVRLALEAGVTALEQQHPAPPPRSKR